MHNGLWTITYDLNGKGMAFPIVIDDNKLMGGNENYYYIGNCSITQGQLNGTITATHFNGKTDPVFGNVSEIKFEISCEINGQTLSGYVREVQTGKPIPCLGTKRT